MPCPLSWHEFRKRCAQSVPSLWVDHGEIMRRFPELTERHDRIIVVASGPSGAPCGRWRKHPGVPVIAVNAAIEGLQFTPDYFVTIDPKPFRRDLWGVERPGCKRFIGCCEDYGPESHDPRYQQDFTGAHILMRKQGKPTRDKRTLFHNNSGIAGIHLALHMEASRIAVFGVDFGGDYWCPEHGPMAQWHGLDQLLLSFQDWGADIRFASHRASRVHGFERMPAADLLAWVQAVDRSGEAAIVGVNSQAQPVA